MSKTERKSVRPPSFDTAMPTSGDDHPPLTLQALEKARKNSPGSESQGSLAEGPAVTDPRLKEAEPRERSLGSNAPGSLRKLNVDRVGDERVEIAGSSRITLDQSLIV